MTAPPLVTEITPARTARVKPTYIVLPLTTIDEMARPSNAGPLYAGAIGKPPIPNMAEQSTPVRPGRSCSPRDVSMWCRRRFHL